MAAASTCGQGARSQGIRTAIITTRCECKPLVHGYVICWCLTLIPRLRSVSSSAEFQKGEKETPTVSTHRIRKRVYRNDLTRLCVPRSLLVAHSQGQVSLVAAVPPCLEAVLSEYALPKMTSQGFRAREPLRVDDVAYCVGENIVNVRLREHQEEKKT